MAWPSARAKTFAKDGNFVPADANAIQDQYVRASGIGADDLDPATVARLVGLSQTGAVRRKFLSIDTSQTRQSSSFGLLTTPDQIDDVVVPSGGLLIVSYSAIWKSNGTSANARLDAVGVLSDAIQRVASGSDAWEDITTSIGANPTLEQHLFTNSSGLATTAGTGYDGEAEPTTGLIEGNHGVTSAGSFLACAAHAGTYDVRVMFSTNGADIVTVKNRRLWVAVLGY